MSAGVGPGAGSAADRALRAYWDRRAESWRVAPPVSPSAPDAAWYEAVARRAAGAAGRPLRALLLGVTPLIAAMAWPDGTRLLAADWSEAMLRRIWPAAGTPPGAARLQADWRALPFPAGSFDLVLGDGCLSAVGTAAAAAEVNREVRRVLRPGGLYGLRCFARPDPAPALEPLFAELRAGRIVNLDLFRWFLLMAVQGDDPDGVVLDAVWRIWRAQLPDAAALAQRFGWRPESLAIIEGWAGSAARYLFPDRALLERLAAPGFARLSWELPDYQPAACFPRLLLQAG
ncbi:MAG: class I SAM-dependent methyltransferase [Dongiaceae bacterium]